MHASKPARRSTARARGFTLIEVLAALVIVSLGMLGVIEAVGQTASNSSRMRDRTLAHWVAMNRLTTARLETRAPNIGKTSDEIEMAGRRWRWTMEVQETPVASMRRIDVRVGEAENDDEDDERSLATVTGFYGTAIAAAGMTAPSWSGTGVPGGPGGPGGPGSESPQGDRDRDRNGDQNEQPNNPPPGGETVDPPSQDPAPESQE